MRRWWKLRRTLLSAELLVRGIPHSRGGDAVTVFADGLWFDVYPWLREDRRWTWVVDHPHADYDDEHPGWEICRTTGFRFRVDELLAHWQRYQAVA